HLERLPLGTPYPAIVAHVGRLLTKLPGRPELVIDYTGVGRPVFDMFVYTGIYPTGVLITGGTTEARDGPTRSVPKVTLVSRFLALAIAVWRAHGGGVGSWGVFEFTRRMAMGATASEPRYFVGVDLGQSRDPTAIAIVRRVEPPRPVPEDDFG